MVDSGKAPAGWFADPFNRFERRFWDGSSWTDSVRKDGQESTDPPGDWDDPFSRPLIFGDEVSDLDVSGSHTHQGSGARFNNRQLWSLSLLISGAVIVGACFLPWDVASSTLTTASLSRNGFQLGRNLSFSADGLITLIGGAVIMAIGALGLSRVKLRWTTSYMPVLVAGIICLDQAVPDISHIHSQVKTGVPLTFSAGYGVWLVLAGAVLAIIVNVIGWTSASRRIARSRPKVDSATGLLNQRDH
jgi:hypothetical protein